MTEAVFQVFESVGAMVVVLDADGRIVHWNHCCSNLTGYSLGEVRGRRLWDFALLPEDVAGVKAVFAKPPACGHASDHANYWVTKTGAHRWIVFTHTTTSHPDGSIQYIIKTGIDQSEHKRAELALKASEAMLGARAAESSRLYEDARNATDDLREANAHMVNATIRAQELTEKVESALTRSEESERDLRAAVEFREMFIGIVGHDLRNPLGAIALTAELLGGRLLDEHDRELVSHIVSASQRMKRMIAQLLDFTRVRLGGGFTIDPTPGDLGDICRAVGQELGASIQLEVEGDLTGSWDHDRVEEALSNIAGNAVEHATPATPVVIAAHAEGEAAVVAISNRGSAIPAELLPTIFEPFHRGTREKSAAGNLGLGLYIAKQIALASGGTLDVRSADGTTTFVMRLPRRAAGRPASSK